MKNSEENSSGSLYYVIPSAVMEDESIQPIEKLLYALLSGLAYGTGECFPSDTYLSKRLKAPERTIQQWLKNLDDVGYISRHTTRDPKNPFIQKRTITVHSNFKKCLPNATHCGTGNATHCTTVKQPIATIVSEVNPLVSEDESGASPPPSSKRKKVKEALVRVEERVFLSHSQINSLKKKLNNDETKLQKCYEILSQWKIGKQIDGGTGDYLAIVNWVIEKVENSIRSSFSPDSSHAVNEKIFKSLKDKYEGRSNDFSFGNNYVEMGRGIAVDHLKISDYGFLDRVNNFLRKIGQEAIKLEG